MGVHLAIAFMKYEPNLWEILTKVKNAITIV